MEHLSRVRSLLPVSLAVASLSRSFRESSSAIFTVAVAGIGHSELAVSSDAGEFTIAV
ncbi:hypothetical protein ACVBEQ_01295 [Nakamurella sp. GG22]